MKRPFKIVKVRRTSDFHDEGKYSNRILCPNIRLHANVIHNIPFLKKISCHLVQHHKQWQLAIFNK